MNLSYKIKIKKQWHLSVQQLPWWQLSLYLIKVLEYGLAKLDFDTKEQVLLKLEIT